MSEAETAAAVERVRQSYDETPYVSSPLIRFQPARMAANARWFGLGAPDARRARVLEIGCASGGHILPLALANPEADYVGIDLSPRQIAAGEARRAALGVANLKLRAKSLAAIDASDGDFDFIICHGVHSWIPEALRGDLMRVVGERLTPEGVAMVSFNVLPGWRLFQIARDAMNLHAGAVADPTERARRARELFAALAAQSSPGRSYGAFWRNEAARMARGDDGYLAHEIFEDSNAPESFDGFCDRLAAQGLAYLTEAALGADGEDALAPEGAETIRALAQGDDRARGRYLDIFSGRSFREALIVKAGRFGSTRPPPALDALDTLHFIAPLDFALARDEEGALTVGSEGSVHVIEGDAAALAMRRLIGRLPGSARLDDLAPAGGADRAAARALLARLVTYGDLAVSTEPLRCAAALGARPKAWELCAADARVGADTVNLRHAHIHLSPIQRLLLPMLDGTRTRDDLLGHALDLADEGHLRMRGPDGPLVGRAAYEARLNPAIDDTLEAFRAQAMLLPN